MELSASISVTGMTRKSAADAPVVPSALGLLPDLTLERDAAMVPQDLSVDFYGPSISYELAPGSDALPPGLVLSSTGQLSGTPSEAVSGLNLVIRGTNPHGVADSGFTLTVQTMLLDFTATLSGATVNPTYGDTAESGVPLTAGAIGFSGATPGSITFQWATQNGPINGATSASYTPDAMTFDGDTLFCTVTPDGYPAKTTPTLVIRNAPPVAAGALMDEIFDLDSGPEILDASVDFTGQGLAYSVTGPGVSIDPATGVLTIQTDSPVAGVAVVITALNSGGQAQSAFTLTIEDDTPGVAPVLGVPVLSEATNTITLNVDLDSTIYWRRDASGTNPTAADVIAGGGFDSGAFAVTTGSNEVDVTFATGNDGLQQISFVAAIAPGAPSNVQSAVIDIDTAAPAITGSAPLAGAGGVAVDTTPSVTFSEAIFAVSGSVTLYDVTGDQVVETFDVTNDAGTAPGQVGISGQSLTIHPSANLSEARDYAVQIAPGALRDAAGNLFDGVSDTTTLRFSTNTPPVIDTDFGAGFVTAEPTLWAAIQANPFNATPEHRGAETWDGYPVSLSDGGIVGLKSGNYPQLRFSVPVEIGKTYVIDADLPVGEGTWGGPLRVKLGSGINLNDYAQVDETQAGQPRVVEIRGLAVTATTAELWFAVIVEINSGGQNGGHPAISMLTVREF